MKRDAVLWAGILTGPAVFLTSFLVNFVLAPWACMFRGKPWLYLVSAAALGITAASGWIAWRQWDELGRELPGDGESAMPRARMMAIGGVLLSALSVLAILSQGIVEAMLGACD